jgi:hypothetical protein
VAAALNVLRLFVVGGGGSHADSLRASLEAAGLTCHIDFFDSDVGALCHLKSASDAPDLILVNGTLMMHEAPEFVRDLKAYPLLTNSRFMVMDPLREDLLELEAMRLPLARKPVTAEQIKMFVTTR